MEKDDGLIRVTVMLHSEQLERLDTAAQQSNASRSWMLRRVLKDWSKGNGSPSPVVAGLVSAWLAGVITAEEAMQAIAGRGAEAVLASGGEAGQ